MMHTHERDERLSQFDDRSTVEVIALRDEARSNDDHEQLRLLNAVLAERGYFE